jgi:hypothetical protein
LREPSVDDAHPERKVEPSELRDCRRERAQELEIVDGVAVDRLSVVPA